MNKYRTVVIEDDPSSRIMITKLLETVFPNQVRIVGSAENVQSGIDLIEAERPDLVFLDIKIKGGTGFDILEKLQFIEFKLVFTTAYDNYAIKSQEYFPFNYIVKPITIEKLQPLFHRLNSETNVFNKQLMNAFMNKLEEVNSPTPPPSPYLVFSDQKGFSKERKTDIAYIRGEGNQSSVIFVDPQKEPRIVSKTLKDFESVLAGSNFLRIHRSYIINADNIARYNTSKGGAVEMLDGTELSVSNGYAQDVKDYLNKFKV